MKKVYYDESIKTWILTEISDIYLFKFLDKKTNQITDGILSWKKSIKNSDFGIAEEDRLYGLDLDNEEVLFVGTYKEGKFLLRATEKYLLDLIENEKGIVFLGEKIESSSFNI
jgi:hypothetical protein